MDKTLPPTPLDLKVRLWPHSDLKKVCSPVLPSDTEFLAQLEAMVALLRKKGGVGLAANQVGIDKRMLIGFRPGVGFVPFVNPQILEFTGEWKMMNEGCLSLPGFVEQVKRCTALVVEYVDPGFNTVVEPFTGITAQVLQHEIEHLDGKMFVDHLKPGMKDRLRAAMRKAGR